MLPYKSVVVARLLFAGEFMSAVPTSRLGIKLVRDCYVYQLYFSKDKVYVKAIFELFKIKNANNK